MVLRTHSTFSFFVQGDSKIDLWSLSALREECEGCFVGKNKIQERTDGPEKCLGHDPNILHFRHNYNTGM